MSEFETFIKNESQKEKFSSLSWNNKDETAYGENANKIFKEGINIKDFIPFNTESLKKLLLLFEQLDQDIDNVFKKPLPTNIKYIKKEYREAVLTRLLDKHLITNIIVHRQLTDILFSLFEKINYDYYKSLIQKAKQEQYIVKVIETLEKKQRNESLDFESIKANNKKSPKNNIDIHNYIDTHKNIRQSKKYHPIITVGGQNEEIEFFVSIARHKKIHTYLTIGCQTYNTQTEKYEAHILTSIGKKPIDKTTIKNLIFSTLKANIQDEDRIKTNEYVSKKNPAKIDYKAYKIEFEEYKKFIGTLRSNRLPVADDQRKPAYYVPIKNENGKITFACSDDIKQPALDPLPPSNNQEHESNHKSDKGNNTTLTKLNGRNNDCANGAIYLLANEFDIIDPSVKPNFLVHLPDRCKYDNGKICRVNNNTTNRKSVPIVNINPKPVIPKLINYLSHKGKSNVDEFEDKFKALQLIHNCITEISKTTYDKALNKKSSNAFERMLKNQKLALWISLYNSIVEDITNTNQESKSLNTIIEEWKNANSEKLKCLSTPRRLRFFTIRTRSKRCLNNLDKMIALPKGSAATKLSKSPAQAA